MGNKVTVLPATRERILQYIIATRGGILNINSGNIKITGTLVKEGQPDTVVTALVHSLCTVLSEDITVELYGNYAASWEELSETEKETIADYVLEQYGLPADPQEKLEERYALRRLNLGFINEHGDLDESDFAEINKISDIVGKTRRFPDNNIRPTAGDLVEGAYYNGKYPFKQGLITSERTGRDNELLCVCAEPNIPFVHESGYHPDGYSLSVSGGPFFNFKEQELEYIGTGGSRFMHVWGHYGPCRNGAVKFPYW